jgi:hypothetical protein
MWPIHPDIKQPELIQELFGNVPLICCYRHQLMQIIEDKHDTVTMIKKTKCIFNSSIPI